ncbi:MAG: LytR family transcriptional regulator [Chloroflexi bacterium]|nr:MAG: LytR family transcriptional regulator [Chloroflexota bacterium]
MSRARPRARRSRYSVSHRLSRSVPALIGAVLLVAIVVTATVAYRRIDDFLSATTGKHLTLGAVVEAVQPEPGTMAYKLQHGQQVNILLLGMGGYENDAPFLTDSIMAVTIDPNSHRVMLASVPRDLVAHMNLQTNAGSIWTNKINAAYEVPYTSIICCVAPQYQGRDGGGHAAEHEVGKITGLTFDRYIAIDFKAFRDMVNALGGVSSRRTSGDRAGSRTSCRRSRRRRRLSTAGRRRRSCWTRCRRTSTPTCRSLT